MKNNFVVGDTVKVLVNGKHRFRGEIIHIVGDTATVVVPVYYVDCFDYMPVESKLEDLWEVKEVM